MDPVRKNLSKKSINKNRNSKDEVEKHLKELKKHPRKKKIKLPHKINKQDHEDDDTDLVMLSKPQKKIQKNKVEKQNKK